MLAEPTEKQVPQIRRDVYTIEGDRLVLNFHAGQWRVWDSRARIVVMLAGTQGGKTVFGSPWLYREVLNRGPGDYLCVAPTYPLMNKKMLPEFKRYFGSTLGLGRYVGGTEKTFTFSDQGNRKTFGEIPLEPTRVMFGHAQDPDSLESATAKAAWLDEAGQPKFKAGSFDAIMRRLLVHVGRVLITTTPYVWGWFKRQLVDAADDNDQIEVIRFATADNPVFGPETIEAERQRLPDWKFKLFFLAQFARPAGMIYKDFNFEKHVVESFEIPRDWTIFFGVDFGGTNTAAVVIARDPETRKLYVIDTYHRGDLTSAEHADNLKHLPLKWFAAASDDDEEDQEGEVFRYTFYAYGGAKSEKQWRREFAKSRFKVRTPKIPEVEIGIDRVVSVLKDDKLFVFNHCKALIDEFETYARVLDENNEPTEEIENKNAFHRLDALRYVIPSCSKGNLIAW